MRARSFPVSFVFAALAAAALGAACFTGPDAPPLSDNANALAGAVNAKPPVGDGGGATGVSTTSDPTALCGGKGVLDGGNCAVSWQKDIFPTLTGGLNCAGSSCHLGSAATPSATPPTIDPKDPRATWINFTNEPVAGKPYINPCSQDPTASSFACNLKEVGTCGSRMPSTGGIADPTFVTQVETWLACGSPFN